MQKKAILKVENLSRRFDGLNVLHDVSFEIAEGACIGLSGNNGSGKTSLLNILFGIDQSDEGCIKYPVNNDGLVDITDWPTWRRAQSGIHYYFQSPRTWKNLTVREHIETALSEGGQDSSILANIHWLFSTSLRNKTREQCDALLEFVELQDREKDFAEELSYGQAKLLSLAQLLACPSRRLFLFDEPLAGLSPTMSRKMLNLLQKVKAGNVAMLLVEHDIEMFGEIADTLFQLKDGMLLKVKDEND